LTRYEIKELSTSKKLSELFTNLQCEVGAEDAVRFSVRLMDEDEVPSEVKEKVINQNTSSIPSEAVEMMKHLPQELRDNFERLWNNQNKKNIKIPPTTDRVTRSMTRTGNVKALIVKSTRLKVKDVLKLSTLQNGLRPSTLKLTL
jgi:phosphatidate phosphatase PAH1